jgi:protocatechuate 3,4-dioxygenase beta subunit
MALVTPAASALAYQTFTAGEETPPVAAQPSDPPAPKADAAPLAARTDDPGPDATFRGRVLDPDGKPFSGAKLHLIGNLWHRPKPVHVQATSAADGGFRLPVAAADDQRLLDEASWATINVVATAEGYGPALRTGGPFEPTAQLTLRLVKDDVPIRGRVLDLQGKPLAGVTIRVRSLKEPSAGDLSPWLAALEANKQDAYPIEATYLEGIPLAEAPEIYPAVTTDAEGRFEMKGVGRERLVRLTLEGPTIARQELSVYTRPGKPIHATGFARNPEGSQLTYYGASFEHTAAPTRPIVGVVRDKDTGKPLAGVTVQSDRFAGTNTGGDSSVRTVTDKDGRYRLVGMPKGVGNAITAVPAAGQPYLRSAQEVADPLGLEPVTVDFALKRGVLVKGRVTDKATGRPVLANVTYVVFRDNPRHAEAPGFAVDHYLQTAEDGSFQLVAFPGRGLLAARGWNDHYRMGVGTDGIKGKYDQRLFDTVPHLQETDTFHTYAQIDPADKAESVTCDLVLDPGTMPHGTLTGPDDKPLTGAEALGLTAYNRSRHWTRAPLKESAFTVYGLGPTDEREVVFVHAARQLAGVVRVRGDAKEPLRVRLESWGTVTGRLVGPDGKPRPGLLLRAEDRFLPGAALQTDKEGRFRVAGLAPGVKYTLQVVQNGQAVATVFDGLALKAAEVRDLGEVVVQPKK